jgi:hypothetical protein
LGFYIDKMGYLGLVNNMPSRLTEERAEAIAQEYCNNGFDKTKALKAIKNADNEQYYSDSYCESLGHKLYSNIKVTTHIERIIKETKAKTVATRQQRRQFWTETMNSKDPKVNMGDKLRASELLGKSECDFSEKIIHEDSDKQRALDKKTEQEQARLHRLGNISLAEIA